jgi:SAM-dependent methyltransferase
LSSAQVLVEKLTKYAPDNKIRMLEMGAGLGYTLKTAKEKGWEVFGTEISPFAVRYAKEKLGLEIFNGGLDEAKFPEEFFDLIVMTHVLEHLTNPYKYLERVFSILKKSGSLYVVVPNIGSFKAWLKSEKWPHLAPGLHLYHFCPRTLKEIVKKAGFRVIHIETSQNIITAEDLSKTKIASLSFLGEKLKKIKRRFPYVLDGIRYFIGKVIPGAGITLVAKK